MDPYSGYLPPYNLESWSNQDHAITSHLIRWKSGKRVDPRLLTMLEQFGEIYVERREFFNKIFHGDHEEVFKKIGNALKKKKSMKKSGSMKRSMSMKAMGHRGIIQEDIHELRPERFRVRTPINVIEVAEDDAQGGQPTTSSSK